MKNSFSIDSVPIILIIIITLVVGCRKEEPKKTTVHTTEAFYKEKPLAIMKNIYSCNDPEKLLTIFEKSYKFAQNNQEIFFKNLQRLNRDNDLVNLLKLNRKETLTPDEESVLCARILARVIFCMGEIENCKNQFSQVMNAILKFPANPDLDKYLVKPVYMAMARISPDTLKDMIYEESTRNLIDAALAALRGNVRIKEKRLQEILEKSDCNTSLCLLYYMNDTHYKLKYIEQEYKKLESLEFFDRLQRNRELINMMASFPGGIELLKRLTNATKIDFVEVDGILFGTQDSNVVSAEEIGKNRESLIKSAKLINLVNSKMSGKEPIKYVDIFPSDASGCPAIWYECSLGMTIDFLRNETPRAVAFVNAHEACEQKYVKGIYSRKFALTWLNAFENKGEVLNMMKTGVRIGGKYAKNGLGHPWDSEREWLAEAGSAVLIGEKLPEAANNSQKAAAELFETDI
jgi:hypothetical protein